MDKKNEMQLYLYGAPDSPIDVIRNGALRQIHYAEWLLDERKRLLDAGRRAKVKKDKSGLVTLFVDRVAGYRCPGQRTRKDGE